MKNSVTVKIVRFENKVVVSNNKGKVWEFPSTFPAGYDDTHNGTIADIASAMLTGTIASQLKESNSKTITYTVIVETK